MYINDAMSKIDCIQIPSIDTRGATRGAKYQGGQISPGGVVDKTRQDKSRQEKNKTRQDKTRQDKT
jgi:hypothetical protein